MRKIWIDRIMDRYFSEPFGKFVVVARIKEKERWACKQLFFDTRKEMQQVQEGRIIDYKY